jgi:hypothetical protein
MGVVVTEEYNLNSGLTLNSYYASINKNNITIEKCLDEYCERVYDPETDTTTENVIIKTRYTARTGFTLWISKEARDAGKSAISFINIDINRETPITENVYTVLYARFKELHPTAVDA